jgi:hypothetical protein
MPLFVIHRTLDSAMPQDERELLVLRSLGPIEPTGVQHPVWHRSFAVQTDDRFETWCVYEGRSRDELAHWNFACRVPFSEVVEVTQWWAPRDGERPGQLQFLQGVVPDDRTSLAATLDSLVAQPHHGSVRWVRSYLDVERSTLYSALLAPNGDAVRAFATERGLPHEAEEVVDEILPTDFAHYYEIAGRVPYNGDD